MFYLRMADVLLHYTSIDTGSLISDILKITLFFSLTGWQAYNPTIENQYSPRALKGELTVNDEFPRDTYFDFDCR